MTLLQWAFFWLRAASGAPSLNLLVSDTRLVPDDGRTTLVPDDGRTFLTPD